MEDYLLDRETLGQFVDALMKKRPLPVDNADELSEFRETQMKKLDDRISQAIFGGLDQRQSDELSQLLDRESDDPEVFRNFFQKEDINVEDIIANAAQSFSAEFLAGGQNE